ncbi:MAG: motility protein A [Planctomycetota bacterium]|nr:MAG: motility protein A [Planctomycetota bacterium]
MPSTDDKTNGNSFFFVGREVVIRAAPCTGRSLFEVLDMDLATFIGLIAAASMLIWTLWNGSDGMLGTYWNGPAAILVLGGSLFVVLTTQAMDKFCALFAILKHTFLVRRQQIAQTIEQIVRLSEKARRDGVLALEDELENIEDEFLSNGIRLMIDGTAANEIEQILDAELEAMDARHNQGKGILETFGKYAPALGMIGTLIGLVAMLHGMNDPSKIGSGMAVALLTTMYGAILANVVFLPLADKLTYRHEEEMMLRSVIVKGILSLHAGDNPRVTQAKLSAFLPINSRNEIPEPAAKKEE